MSRASAGEKDLARTIRRWVVGILLGTVILVIASFLIWRTILSSRINASLARMKAAGYPTNPKELNQWYREVPNDENAALVFLAGAEEIQEAKDKIETEVFEWIATNRNSSLPPQLKQRLTARLEANRSALVRLHEATAKSRSRYPVDFREGFNTDWKYLSTVRAAASLLRAESVQLCEDGKADDAAESIRVIFRLAESLADEPTLMSQLVRLAIDEIGRYGLQKVLSSGQVGAPKLAALMSALDRADEVTRLQRGLAGERAMAIPVFRFEAKYPADDGGPPRLIVEGGKRSLLKWTGLFERDLRFFLQIMETNLAMVALPEPENLRSTNQMAVQDLEARRKYFILSSLQLTALDRAVARQADHAARVRTARTALAIELFRAEHAGERPATLDALVPDYLKAIPKDPFDGHALRYKLRPKGYVVYSIGLDGKDDGGKERPPRKKGGNRDEAFDITFTVDR